MDQRSFFAALSTAPCLNVNGLSGGYDGAGSKTVLPAQGCAKLDFRLVPDQHPTAIGDLVRRHLEAHGFGDIDVAVLDANVRATRTSPDHWFVQMVLPLLSARFGAPAIVQPSSPASGLAHPFVKRLGAAVLGIGLTHHGARMHAPDENILVSHLDHMIAFSSDLFAALARKAETPST